MGAFRTTLLVSITSAPTIGRHSTAIGQQTKIAGTVAADDLLVLFGRSQGKYPRRTVIRDTCPAFIAKPNCWPLLFSTPVLRVLKYPCGLPIRGSYGTAQAGPASRSTFAYVVAGPLKVSVSLFAAWTGARAAAHETKRLPQNRFTCPIRSAAGASASTAHTSCASICAFSSIRRTSRQLEPASRAQIQRQLLDIMRRSFAFVAGQQPLARSSCPVTDP